MPSSALQSISLQSPGTLGLNTQDKDNVQDPRYATEALNCVISGNGLLEARKGAKRLNATPATGADKATVMYSYVQDDGTEFIISCSNNMIWVGTSTLTNKTGTLTITLDRWQFQTYKGEVFGYQESHAPIYWDGGAGNFVLLSTKGTAAGLVNSPCHHAAFGRSWVVDPSNPSVVKYSDLLVPEDFNAAGAGSIDLNNVWPYSNDTITTIASHNNNLIIFCEKSIVIYGNADVIANIALVEVIRDIGCVARDSIQTVGDDIFFLANDGVRSLARTILQDNMPQKEISAPVRDDLISNIDDCDLGLVRSTYNEKEGFYALTISSLLFGSLKQYVCDVRLSDKGIYRWTEWGGDFYSFETSKANTDKLYIGLAGGYIAEYDGYYDTDTSDGGVDLAYAIKYRSGWIDAGLGAVKAVWKKAVYYIKTRINNPFTATWSFDFKTDESSQTKDMTAGTAAVYGTATYGTGTYGGDVNRNETTISMSKTGSIVKVGFQSNVKDGEFGFNRINLFFKAGKRA